MPSAFVRGKGARRRFYVRWKNAQGVWRKEMYPCDTLTEAKEEARRREQDAHDARHGKKRALKKDISVRQAVELHLEALPSDFATRDTLEGLYRNRFLEVPAEGTTKAGDIMCREFTAAHLKVVLACKKDCSQPKPARPGSTKVRALRPNAEVSVQTREHVRVAVQALFTFLKQAKRVEGENPAGELGKLKLRKKTPKFLKAEEMPLFIAAVPAERRLHFAFNLASGARKSESLDLQWTHVREDQGHVILDITKDKEGRVVFLPDWLLLLLRVARTEATSRWVFPIPEGRKGAGGRQPKSVPLHDVTKAALRKAGLIEGYEAKCVKRARGVGACGFSVVRKEAGTLECPGCHRNTLEVTAIPIPITFHNLRSTFASWAYAHTRDIRFVQMMLGHSDTRVTERYAAAMDAHMRILANQVQLNPFGPPAAGLNPGTPVGQAEGNGVPFGATQGITPDSQAIVETRNADS
jgi:integrase